MGRVGILLTQILETKLPFHFYTNCHTTIGHWALKINYLCTCYKTYYKTQDTMIIYGLPAQRVPLLNGKPEVKA